MPQFLIFCLIHRFAAMYMLFVVHRVENKLMEFIVCFIRFLYQKRLSVISSGDILLHAKHSASSVVQV